MLIPFETFIEKANYAKSTTELVTTFLDKVGQHGFDRMILCLLTDHSHIGFEAGVGVIQNYPQDWMNYYFEHGYDALDPVITMAHSKLDTFTWAEIPKKLQLSRKQYKCLNLGIEAGLYNGVCAPIWGPHKFAGIGLATKEKKDACDTNLDIITAYCHHFYIALERLHRGRVPCEDELSNIALTHREREILTWAAAGLSEADIGERLYISEHTVDGHMCNIYAKLNANNRTMAVVKAISLGLIRP